MSFVKDQLQPIQTKYLKKWSGLARAADPSVLYKSRENAGLGLKESCEEHKRQRLIQRHQLTTSKDPRVRAIHEEFAKSQRQSQGGMLRVPVGRSSSFEEQLEQAQAIDHEAE